MSVKVVYVTSTQSEAEALKRAADYSGNEHRYHSGKADIDLLISGVGSVATSWSLMNYISSSEKPFLAVNGGIAGSYNPEFPVGSVVMPVTDCFADSGIEDGSDFRTLFEAGLASPAEYPFSNGLLKVPEGLVTLYRGIAKPVKAITVNTATGSESTRERLMRKFHPDIETMEGAAFFYVCLKENIPFISLRSVSNIVERRNKEKWDIPAAIEQLSLKLKELFNKIEKL